MLKQISDQNAAKKNVNIHTFRYKHINLFIQKIAIKAILIYASKNYRTELEIISGRWKVSINELID